MSYTDAEKKLAIRLHELLKAKGKLPEIREGDWCLGKDDKPLLITFLGEFLSSKFGDRDKVILLWSWSRCREWLREKDWGAINMAADDGSTDLIVINTPGKHKEGHGQTDLEAILAVMIAVAEEEKHESD